MFKDSDLIYILFPQLCSTISSQRVYRTKNVLRCGPLTTTKKPLLAPFSQHKTQIYQAGFRDPLQSGSNALQGFYSSVTPPTCCHYHVLCRFEYTKFGDLYSCLRFFHYLDYMYLHLPPSQLLLFSPISNAPLGFTISVISSVKLSLTAPQALPLVCRYTSDSMYQIVFELLIYMFLKHVHEKTQSTNKCGTSF